MSHWVGGAQRGASSATALPGQLTANSVVTSLQLYLRANWSQKTKWDAAGQSRESGTICIRNKNMPTLLIFLQAWSHSTQQQWQAQAQEAKKPLLWHSPGVISSHHQLQRHDGGDINIPLLIPVSHMTWVPPCSSLAVQAPPSRSITTITLVTMSGANGHPESWLRDNPHCPTAAISSRVAKYQPLTKF